jgi:RHS repeat-associated protein
MKRYLLLLLLILCGTRKTDAQTFTPDTKGELQISNSGTATYKVPIALPPGIRDVAPQLALTYSGSSVQGMAGMGWNLVGISSISRVSSSINIDGLIDPVDFDNLDRFALDGQRLIEKTGVYGAAGTTYQTENYTNLKIESSGTFWHKAVEQCRNYDFGGYPQTDCTTASSVTNSAPESFTVTFIDGSKAYYGGTTDSRGLMNWMINRWIDPQGNYIDYTYETENNTQRIKKISWGNNSNVASGYENKIEFNYKARLRTEYSYINYNNIKIEVNKILSDVSVLTGGQLFRKYTINHETVSGNYQRVKSITETNGANEDANPIVFDYDNTAEGFAPIVKYSGATDSDLVNVKLSGDFDGNGEQDFVTDSKLYLNPIDNGGAWTGINFDLGKKYFTAITLANNKLNQFQSIVLADEKSNSIEFKVNNLVNGALSLDYSKTINFNNNIYHDVSLDTENIYHSTLSVGYHNCNVPIIKESNEYLEGDFNGDGLSEVLICSTKNERFYYVKKEYYRPSDGETIGNSCDTKIINDGKECYLLNLDPNASLTLGNNGFLKLQNDAALQGEKKYVIDFNGDGKSDILVINANKTYNVIGIKQLAVAPWVELEILSKGKYDALLGVFSGQDSFPEYDNAKQIVFGDFNGDSKTDIMIPEADGSSNWFLYQSTGSGFERISYPNFELYQPYWQGAPSINRTRNKSYRAADLDKDGKSDFIIQEYETLCVTVGLNGCDRNGRGHFTVRKNIGGLSAKPTFEAQVEISVNSDYGYSTPIDLLIGNYRNHGAYNNFVFIQGKQIWKGNFNKDLSKESTLIKVTEAGGDIVQNISYKKLVPSGTGLGTANDLYYSSNTESYPFTELSRVPTMLVVDQLTATANNITKIQLFKYFGLVTHSQGLGVLGFKKTARSSWYTAQQLAKIWNISVTSPQLKGATIREFTSILDSVPDPKMEGIDKSNPTSLILNTPVTTTQTAIAINSIILKPGFSAKGSNGIFRTQLTQSVPQTDNATANDYLTRKDYYYKEVDKGNKITALQITKTTTKDVIAGTFSENSFEYDAFENIEKTINNNGIATTTVQNTYENKPTVTDNTYCIGKLKQTNQSVTAYSDTFTSEEKYIYDPVIPNLVKQSLKKGHNTDYITTDFVYDAFGNVTQKTISAPGVTSRKVTDIYDPNGRFVISKTDNDDYVTTFEYNKLGQQTKSKNYLDVETVTVFDNWGKLLTSSTTGASLTAQTQTFAYIRDPSGYNVTTTTNTPGDFSRTFYDVFGREIKTTKRGFAANTYISKSVEYDFLGRKIKESEPYFDNSPSSSATSFPKVNTIIYDYLSRPMTQSFFTGKQISIGYNGLTSGTNDGTKIITTTNDANGNKIEQITNGEQLKFTYYANGNLKETIYGNHTIVMQYDGWGRQIYMKDPSVSSIPYTNTYNNFGEIRTETTPTGTTTIDYTPKGKILKKTQSGQNTNQVSDYFYDTKGFVTSETGTINGKYFAYTFTYTPYYQIETNTENTPNNLTNKKTFIYDSFGRVLRENTNSYLTGNTTVNNGNNTIEYNYNTYNGLIDQYKDFNTNTVLWKLNTANEKMQALTASLGNGMQITNEYDNFGYFKTANHASTTTTALNLEYQFQAVRGLLNFRKNNIAGVLSWNESFDYDNQDRLKSWTDLTGTTSNTYETDGRIKTNDLVGAYNYDVGNRYRKKSATLNTVGNVYYANRCPQTVSYDMFKNPITITEATRGKVDFEYNLSNSRSKSVVTTEAGTIAKTKYYSGITAVEVIERPNQSLQFITYIAGSPYDAAVALEKTYTNSGGNYTPSTQEYLYLHRDYQGTILAISGNGGVIKERRQFDAWGLLKKYYKNNVEVSPATFNNVDFELLTDRGYTAHEHFFSVGIIHMNARLYDPILHTFLSPDALIADPSNPQNYNRYAYALNNPLMYVDYDGNEPITAAVLITAAIIGAVIGGVTYVGLSLYNGTAITWGGLTKSILVGAVSGAATCGIGAVAQSATTAIFGTTAGTTLNWTLVAITKGVMHGAAQGIIQGVSGGNAGQSFLTAMATSVAGSIFQIDGNGVAEGLGWADSVRGSIGGEALFGSFTGGVTSRLQGGNFWEGAAIGLTVSLLNCAGNKLYPAIDRMMQGKQSKTILEIVYQRINETENSTTGTYYIEGTDIKGYFIEPSGPSTTQSNQDKRIPAGKYYLKINSGKKYGLLIYNSEVSQSRAILIHIGNYPSDTVGCLLPGKTLGIDFVGNSGTALKDIMSSYYTFNNSQVELRLKIIDIKK